MPAGSGTDVGAAGSATVAERRGRLACGLRPIRGRRGDAGGRSDVPPACPASATTARSTGADEAPPEGGGETATRSPPSPVTTALSATGGGRIAVEVVG